MQIRRNHVNRCPDELLLYTWVLSVSSGAIQNATHISNFIGLKWRTRAVPPTEMVMVLGTFDFMLVETSNIAHSPTLLGTVGTYHRLMLQSYNSSDN